MNTISKCFLFIAVLCPLALANLCCFVEELLTCKYWMAIFNFFSLAICICGIISTYKQSKKIEGMMRNRIASIEYFQFLSLVGKMFENPFNFNKNGFANEQKDKEDEVEEHNGTPV